MATLSPDFTASIETITHWLAQKPVEPTLAAALSEAFPVDGEVFQTLARSCEEGVRNGWLCQRGQAPLLWSRPVKPGPETLNYSVDVVHMTDLAGPHHAHPNGEIDAIFPLDSDAKFDGHGRGWLVYGPGTAHAPTVSGGRAIVLYLLPNGEITFT